MVNQNVSKLLSNLENSKEFRKQLKRFLKQGILNGTEESIDGATILEEAIYHGYSEEEIVSLVCICAKAKVDFNYQSSMYGDTFMHALIEANDYKGRISYLLYFSYKLGFNPWLKNKAGKTVWDCLKNPDTTKQFDSKDIQLCWEIKKLFDCQALYHQMKKIQMEFEELVEEENQQLKMYKDKKAQLLCKQQSLTDELSLYQDVSEAKIKKKIQTHTW